MYVSLSTEAFLSAPRATTFFNVALADPHARMTACERFLGQGFKPVSIISRQAIVMGPADIGEGAIICGFCTITTNVRIGRFFHANIYSYVEHDAVIGDYVTFAPRVNCNGNITIKDFAYIGNAAAIRQGEFWSANGDRARRGRRDGRSCAWLGAGWRNRRRQSRNAHSQENRRKTSTLIARV